MIRVRPTEDVTKSEFSDWIEIDNTFEDGGWVFAGDLYLDSEGVSHLLWYRAPQSIVSSGTSSH